MTNLFWQNFKNDFDDLILIDPDYVSIVGFEWILLSNLKFVVEVNY